MEKLDADIIKAMVAKHNQPLLTHIQIVSSIDSTNSFLLANAKQYPQGYVLFAEEQTAGRGRQGKTWVSPKSKNIYASILWHVTSHISLAPIGLAVAVMLVKALQTIGVTAGIQLKWPNDIYVNERKLAGILIESLALNEENYAVVIGFGLNVDTSGDTSLADKAITLVEINNNIEARNNLAATLLDALLTGLTRYNRHGFTDFISDWQRYDMLPGKSIVVRTSQFSIPGIALGVNPHGELLVRDEYGKEHAFHSGEVSVMFA